MSELREKYESGYFVDPKEAAQAYDSLMWGDPGITKEEVVRLYVGAERWARDIESRMGGLIFSRHPITIQRLKSLGVNPETLDPIED